MSARYVRIYTDRIQWPEHGWFGFEFPVRRTFRDQQKIMVHNLWTGLESWKIVLHEFIKVCSHLGTYRLWSISYGRSNCPLIIKCEAPFTYRFSSFQQLVYLRLPFWLRSIVKHLFPSCEYFCRAEKVRVWKLLMSDPLY